jgi:peptidoglycan hydrolase CwlO-like protein
MNSATLMGWLGGIAAMLTVINTIWILVNRGTAHFGDKLEKHDSKLADHDRRIQGVESDVKHLPAKSEINEVKLSMARMEGHIEKLEASVTTMERMVIRMDSFLREESK